MNTVLGNKALGITTALIIAVAAAALFFAASAHAAGNGSFAQSVSNNSPDPGQSFTLTINGTSDVAITGAQTDVVFDNTRLQVTDVQLGPAWSTAQYIIGTGGQTEAQAIASANGTGTLQNIAGYFPPATGSVAAGTNLFATVTFQALANGGSSSISLAQNEMIDMGGGPLAMSGPAPITIFVSGPISVGGVVETIVGGSDGGSTLPVLWIAAAALGIGALATGGLVTARRRQEKNA